MSVWLERREGVNFTAKTWSRFYCYGTFPLPCLNAFNPFTQPSFHYPSSFDIPSGLQGPPGNREQRLLFQFHPVCLFPVLLRIAKICTVQFSLPCQQSQAFIPRTAVEQLSTSNSRWLLPKNNILPLSSMKGCMDFSWQLSVTGIWHQVSARDTLCLKSRALFYAFKKLVL